VHAIAFTQRGYPGSTPLDSDFEAKMTPRELYDILVKDLLAILRTLRDDLGIKHVTLLAWSQGCNISNGLFTPEHLPATISLLPFLRTVVYWEIATIGAQGLPMSATGLKYFNRESPLYYIGGFFAYPEEYLAAAIPCQSHQIFEIEKHTADHPGFPEWAEKAQDLRTLLVSRFPCPHNDPSKIMERAREAHHNLAKLDIKKAVIYGTKAAPECVEGCWTSRDWIQEVGGKCQVIVLKDANHFALFHEPERLWKAMMQV
jgi:pimeloyl-ACP methyl ester carboxylesterase